MQRIGTANWYVSSRQNGLTDTEQTLMQHAKEALQNALQKTNTFFAEHWNTYKTKMEAIDLKPFKETKVFSID